MQWAANPIGLHLSKRPLTWLGSALAGCTWIIIGLISTANGQPTADVSAVVPEAMSPSVQADSVQPEDPMLAYLLRRLDRDPGHADSWRLVGKLHRKSGRVADAVHCLNRAIELGPADAAAHFDMGELMASLGDDATADKHFRMVVVVAPQSEYAQALYQSNRVPRPDNASLSGHHDDGMIEQVRYEIQTFDSSDELTDRLEDVEDEITIQPKSIQASLELGALYNSNVTLTPISRELINSEAASFQGFASPDLEWTIRRGESSRSGLSANGYLTINEGRFSSFDLVSLQPGWFAEREDGDGTQALISRIEYLYSVDWLGGDRFGDRHGLTASLTWIRPDLDVIYAFINPSYSQFNDDGDNPSVTSLDGAAVTVGISRFFTTRSAVFPTYSLGVDAGLADTEGDDFRYHSANAFADTTLVINQRWTVLPSTGVGLRNYDDFTGAVNRDELTWRLHIKLKYAPSQKLSIAGVVGHDRFASDNEDFDAQRTQAGIVTVIGY